MRIRINRFAVVAVWVLACSVATLRAEDQGIPAGFRFVGNYQCAKRVKIRDGSPFPVATKPFVCRVYTDGISVRVYGDGGMEGHTTFSIYRNDGVMTSSARGVVETVPGLQAQTVVGNVMRQLTLTQERMVLTRFPALSDVVEVTYANRRITLSRNE